MKHMPDYNPRHIGDYVYELLDKRGMKRSEFCKLGNIPNGTAARLFHPKSPKMGHDLYVKTCILLKLNKEERETLKRIAFPYEALMEYLIDNNMSHNEADYLFEELNLPLLFSSEKDK